MMDQYDIENQRSFDFIFNHVFFDKWKKFKKGDNVGEFPMLELFITSECNQKCTYCYLNKHGNRLYPINIRNHDLILNNLESLLSYFLDNNIPIPYMCLFSGEAIGNHLLTQVLDYLLMYHDKGLVLNFIIIPTNFSFSTESKKIEMIENYIFEFKKRDITLALSASIDGLFLENKTRSFHDESINELRDESFYDRIFQFCKKHNFCFHPMISAYGIENWSDNFDWWTMMFHKYDMSLGEKMMLLEVRNDDWTDDKINHYLTFLTKFLEFAKDKIYDNDLELMALDLFRLIPSHLSKIKNYTPISMNQYEDTSTCSISRCLTVRLGDLMIVPCHRLAYGKYHYGQFILNEGKIETIRSKNYSFAIQSYVANQISGNFRCDSCLINRICNRGCLGSQYETMEDPLIPIPSVCKLMKNKYLYLSKEYKRLGLLDILDLGEFKKYGKYVDINKWIQSVECIKRIKELDENSGLTDHYGEIRIENLTRLDIMNRMNSCIVTPNELPRVPGQSYKLTVRETENYPSYQEHYRIDNDGRIIRELGNKKIQGFNHEFINTLDNE